MPIEPGPAGFFEWHDGPGRAPLLGFASARARECLDYFHSRPFQGFFGHPSFGFEQDHLDFLRDATSATQLWFWDIALTDIEGLYSLPQLKFLGVNPRRPGIDFSRLGALETLINHWIPADHGLERSPVSTYHLWHYKPRTKSFDGLPIPGNVERLQFYWANPASLAGLPVLPRLKQLEFHRCRNLSDVSLVPTIAPGLRVLAATTCTRLKESAYQFEHPTLEFRALNGNRIVPS